MSEYPWIDDLVEGLGFYRSEQPSWQPPTERDFERVERNVGGRLSDEYRYFIAKYGGGMLLNENYTIEAPIVEPCPWGDSVSPERLYAPGEGRRTLEDSLATYHGRIPPGVLPISHDAGGNLVCLDVAGGFPGSVWFWDHEQRWFQHSLEEAARELEAKGADGRRLSVHDIIRGWARLHADQFDRPADYMGMYRMAPTFAEFLRSLHPVG